MTARKNSTAEVAAPNANDIIGGIVDACFAASRPSLFALAYGDTKKSGSWTRGILRGNVGVHVNKGDPFDITAKTAMLTNPRVRAKVVAHAMASGVSESDATNALNERVPLPA